MITEIGLAAGTIWQFLMNAARAGFRSWWGVSGNRRHCCSWRLAGWPARGYVVVHHEGTDYRVTLRNERTAHA